MPNLLPAQSPLLPPGHHHCLSSQDCTIHFTPVHLPYFVIYLIVYDCYILYILLISVLMVVWLVILTTLLHGGSKMTVISLMLYVEHSIFDNRVDFELVLLLIDMVVVRFRYK